MQTSSKQVQKRLKPTELDLLTDISSNLNASKIATKYSFSKGSVSNWLKKLVEKNLIHKAGYGTWELTQTGSEQVQKTKDGLAKEGEFFYDDVEISYPIELKGESPFKDGTWNLNRYVTFSKLNFGEWTVINNNNKSLTIKFPKVYGKDELEPISKVNYWSHQLIEEISAKYPQIKVLSKIPKMTKCGSLGSTKLNTLLANTLKNVTIRSQDYDADNTPKPALEFKVRDNPFTAAGKLKRTVDIISSGTYEELLSVIITQQAEFSKNLQLHLTAIQEIRDAIKELKEVLKNGKER